MPNVPVHVVVLDRLLRAVESRIEDHRTKTGDGLEDKIYQQHVGRIKEAKALKAEIEDLQKQLRHDEDIEDTSERKNPRRRSR